MFQTLYFSSAKDPAQRRSLRRNCIIAHNRARSFSVQPRFCPAQSIKPAARLCHAIANCLDAPASAARFRSDALTAQDNRPALWRKRPHIAARPAFPRNRRQCGAARSCPRFSGRRRQTDKTRLARQSFHIYIRKPRPNASHAARFRSNALTAQDSRPALWRKRAHIAARPAFPRNRRQCGEITSPPRRQYALSPGSSRAACAFRSCTGASAR